MQDPVDLEWRVLSRLVSEFGGEVNLARRVQQWREEMGWTQPKLAERMTNAGYPMNKTSIWKIENPDKPAGRRSISIGEAIGFARVFEKSVEELLLPDDAFAEAEAWKSFLEAGQKLNEVRQAWDEYVLLMAAVRERVARNPRLRESIEKLRSDAEAKREAHEKERWERHKRLTDLPVNPDAERSTIESFQSQHEPTPAFVAANDALSTKQLRPDIWHKRETE